MGFSETLRKTVSDLENATDEVVGKAKAKYDETMTPEKKAEIFNKVDEGMKNADVALTDVAETVGKEVQSFMNGNSGDKK